MAIIPKMAVVGWIRRDGKGKRLISECILKKNQQCLMVLHVICESNK